MSKTRRVNIKAILTNPALRKELMISTIQATQARAGIETTQEQAARAYDKAITTTDNPIDTIDQGS